jgi:Predicted AAA-ATPase
MAFKPNLFVLHLCHNPYPSGRLPTCWVTRVRPEWSFIAEFRLPLIFRPRTFSTSRLKDADGVIEPKRSRIGDSTLTINGDLRDFDPTGANFGRILGEQGQVYFDRTRYISVLDRFKKPILFLRPRRFGKSLTVNMLEHFHGLQYMDAHKSIYQVCDLSLIILACETNCLGSSTVGTRRTKRYHGWTGDARAIFHLEG